MSAVTRFALAFALAFLAVGPSAHAKVGDPAPAFTLVDLDGNKRSLADYAGKTVVLEWLNYDCPFVKKHYDSGNMPKLQKQYTADGVVWLAIVSSAPGKQGNYPPAELKAKGAEKGAAPTAVLLDPDGTVGRAYGAKTTPHMYVVDGEGVLRYEGAIDSVPSTDADDIAGATNYVAGAIQAVKAGEDVEPATTQAYGCSVKY